MMYNCIPQLKNSLVNQYKAALAEARRKIDWHKREISYLEAERDQLSFDWEERKAQKLLADICENEKDIRSLEVDIRALQTELKRFGVQAA